MNKRSSYVTSCLQENLTMANSHNTCTLQLSEFSLIFQAGIQCLYSSSPGRKALTLFKPLPDIFLYFIIFQFTLIIGLF